MRSTTILSLVACLGLLASTLVGGVVTAVSCSGADVQAAINSATNGDTVFVPSGSCTWTTAVSIPNTKGITLQGAGIDVTTIVDSIATDNTLTVNVKNGNALAVVTGFTFDANQTNKTGSFSEVSVDTTLDSVDSFRIHRNKITNILRRGINVISSGPPISGLIDRNTICPVQTNQAAQTISLFGDNDEGYEPFGRPVSFGSNSSVYVEDNTFCTAPPNDGPFDAYSGIRYVFRFNTVNFGTVAHHGTWSAARRAVVHCEIYGNTINDNGTPSATGAIQSRDSTCMIFDNIISGSYGAGLNIVTFRNERSCSGPGVFGICDGTSTWDENQMGQSGYACVDQVGHKFGADPVADMGANTLIGTYVWNNFWNGSLTNLIRYTGGCAAEDTHVAANRDFYNQTATFNGTVGIGRGTIASRPATCTTGVAYWATDEGSWNTINPGADGQLYKCTATNTWTLYYVPYAYPHPLTGANKYCCR